MISKFTIIPLILCTVLSNEQPDHPLMHIEDSAFRVGTESNPEAVARYLREDSMVLGIQSIVLDAGLGRITTLEQVVARFNNLDKGFFSYESICRSIRYLNIAENEGVLGGNARFALISVLSIIILHEARVEDYASLHASSYSMNSGLTLRRTEGGRSERVQKEGPTRHLDLRLKYDWGNAAMPALRREVSQLISRVQDDDWEHAQADMVNHFGQNQVHRLIKKYQ